MSPDIDPSNQFANFFHKPILSEKPANAHKMGRVVLSASF
jgi:hypothetical protein